MSVCAANKQNGEPCSLPALAGSTLCWAHAPENAEARRLKAIKGGRSKTPAMEIKDIKALIRRYMKDVEKGELDRGTGSVLAQLAGVLLRTHEVERKILETQELAAEIEELKRAINNERGGSWAG
jgi:hypothetical protein